MRCLRVYYLCQFIPVPFARGVTVHLTLTEARDLCGGRGQVGGQEGLPNSI